MRRMIWPGVVVISLSTSVSALAQVPELQSISLTPSVVQAGTQTQLQVHVVNATAIEALFLVHENGSHGQIGISAFVQNGDLFTGTLSIPSTALNGEWQIQELGVVGSGGSSYRFIDSSLGFGLPACPVFDNIGVFACDSDIVRDSGSFSVTGGVDPLPPPALTDILITPNPAIPGGIAVMALAVTNTEEIEVIFWSRPAGTTGSLPIAAFEKQNDSFSAEIDVPLNAATGTWRVREVGVRDAAGQTYRFINSDLEFGLPACPTFQNIGVFACSSDIVRDLGVLTVGGANDALPDPVLIALTLNPPGVAVGGSTQLTLEITNADDIESLFFIRPDGTGGFLPRDAFQRMGNVFSTTVYAPPGTATGTWRISELGIRNGIDEVYRFLNSSLFPDVSPCPTFENIGLFGCSSNVVRDMGSLAVGATPPLLTLPEQLQELIDDVAEIGNQGMSKSLLAKLKGVLDHPRRAGINRLHAFVNQVRALVGAGRISADVGAGLIQGAEALAVRLEG